MFHFIDEFKKIKELAGSPDDNTRLNSLSIIGMFYLNNFDVLLEPTEFTEFFNYINSEDVDVRENVLIVLNDLPDDFTNMIVLRYNDLFKAFISEGESEGNSEIIKNLMVKFLIYIPISVCLRNLAELEPLISKEKEQWKLSLP